MSWALGVAEAFSLQQPPLWPVMQPVLKRAEQSDFEARAGSSPSNGSWIIEGRFVAKHQLSLRVYPSLTPVVS